MLGKQQPNIGIPRKELPSFIGGLRLRFILFNWGWPGVRLEIYTEGIRVGPSFLFFRLIVPTRSIRFDDLAEIVLVGSRFPNRGILFRSQANGSWVLFWTLFNRDAILELLSQLTDTISRTPIKFNRLNPGSEDSYTLNPPFL